MRIRGLDHKHVDHLVEKFDVAMRQSMQHVLTTGLTAAVENSPEPYTVISGIQAAWVQQLETELEPMLGEIFITAANGVAGQLGKFPVKIPTGDYAQHVLQTSLSHVQDFSSDIWETATQQVTLGLHDGDSIAQIASRIEDVAEIKAKKAKVVAQTAVIGAVNGGEWAQMMHSASTFDLVMTKEWLATHDTHVRQTHAAADGQTVPLTEKFSIGEVFLDYPGDPAGPPSEIVSCRCTTGYDVDVEDQSESLQSSLEDGSTSTPVATNGLTAAFNEAEHPRGKNGKFITKGAGLPNVIFDVLKSLKSGDDWSDFTDGEKIDFTAHLGTITPKQWVNLKDDDKSKIQDAAADALDEGIPGSASGAMHLEDLDSSDHPIDLSPDEDVFNPDTSVPTGAGDDEQALDLKKQVHKLLQDGKMSEDEAHALYDWIDKGHYDVTQTYIKTLDKSGSSSPIGVSIGLNDSISEPTGGTPIKMTHGLIHAKHSPGEIIAQTNDGKVQITWTGSDYKISFKSGGLSDNVKKSKLYAHLASNFPNENWKSAGATSAAKPIHPLTKVGTPSPLFPKDTVADKIDDAFPLSNTLAPMTSPVDVGAKPLKSLGSPLTPATGEQKLDMTGWKQVGTNPGGFNTGGFFESPSGEKYYVKSISNPDAAKSEILSAQLYKAAGVDTAEVRHVGAGAPPGWSNVIASKVVEGESAAKLMSSKSHNDFKDKIAEGFAVDAWLANWDTVGSGDTKYSNILNVNGKPVHIDVGGSLQVGGTGQKKHGKFTSANVVELNTLKDPAFNKETANVFGAMTPEQEKNSAKKLMGVTDAQIDQLVSDSGLDPKIAKLLKERRDFILDKYGLKDGSSNPVVEMMTDVDMPDDSPVVEMWTDVIDTSVPSSPSVAPTTTAFPTEGIAHVPSDAKTGFYNNFKAEKVSPAWSGAKIFNSLQVAKSKSSSPEVQSLTTKQMLQLVDQQHQVKTAGKIDATPYADKVRAWLKTPNGKKAALTAKSGGAPAPLSTGYAKKVAKAAATKAPTSTIKSISVTDALGVDHTPNIHSTAKIDIYNQFKTAPTGKYLSSSPPADLFYNAFQQSSNAFGGSEVVSPLDVLKIVDSETSAKVGVTNNHLFEKKVTDWLNTPTGKKTAYQIVNEDFNPAAAKAAKKIAPGVTGVPSGTKVLGNTPHTQKIQSVAQTVPSFDPSLGKSDFPVTSTSAASSLWNSMTTADNGGPLKTNQKAALKSYTGSGFSSMNNFLRGKSDASDVTANKVKLAQAGMRPSTENIVLHRGAQFFKDWQSYDEIKAKEGQVWHEPAFFSASVGGTSAFHGSIKYEIQVPKGTPMAWVAGFSQHKGEREMLLAAGLKYQIISVTKKSGSYTTDVVMRVVPDDTEAVNVVASGG